MRVKCEPDVATKSYEDAGDRIMDDDLFEKGLAKRKSTLGADYVEKNLAAADEFTKPCLLYTSPSPRDLSTSRMPSSA